MAKFPTEVDRSVTVKAPLAKVYKYLWDVVGSSVCVPGIDTCKALGKDTYRFVMQERSSGPVSMVVQYTARYKGNGKDEIIFEGTNAKDDNTEVYGEIRLEPAGAGSTKIRLKQKMAPDTPVPRLLQGLLKSFVEKEADEAVRAYLAEVKSEIESA